MRGVELVVRTIYPNIVCGDFNATPQEACIKRMRDAGYADLGSDEGTFNNFDENALHPPKIDYIFTRPLLSGQAKVVREQFVSDHWALVAEVFGSSF